MARPGLSIIVPTYNEKENIKVLLPKLARIFRSRTYEIIVVDDSSPDGTGRIVQEAGRKDKRIRLLTRTKKEGIGAALRAGYDAARNEIILSMDADMSFAPEDLLKLLARIDKGHDLVTADRHAKGVLYERTTLRVWLKGWISKWGNRVVTVGLPAHDLSANFRAIRRKVWKSIRTVEHGNALLGEMIVKAHRKGYKVSGVKVDFRDRRVGVSKINPFKEAPKFLVKVLWYRIRG